MQVLEVLQDDCVYVSVLRYPEVGMSRKLAVVDTVKLISSKFWD